MMKEKNDKKLFSILFIFTLVYSNIKIAKQSYFKFKGYALDDISWTNFFIEYYLTDILIMTMLLALILFLTKKMIHKDFSRYAILSVHLFFAAVTWVLAYVIYYLYRFTILELNFDNFNWNEAVFNIVNYSDRHFMFYFVNVFIIYTYFYINKSSQIELQKAQLKQQLTNVQVNVLKYQLHPHFFFNTLNSISTLIETDAKLAQNTLADFSNLLRDILFLKDTNLMPLSVEMKILKRYIDIMSIRFSDHLKVSIHVEDNLGDVLIPSLILQPILENSIKHGYSYDSTDLKIDIDIFQKESNLHIEVINNGEPLSENIKYGTGLKNTVDRLITLYENNFIFSIENRKDKIGVITQMIIPIKS
ncbi:sensor histidine kinase [Hanstruepera ponticola]|uniref:sensor histidine kinase n=1 Tax=Hanstruepera ponticola TaxID=2042995 RepID=UPI00177E1134|nr:histidine kinase [Hanstruepera ponticola]